MLSKLDMLAAACAAFDRRGIVVRNELCLRTRHRKSACLRCSSVCPTGAISLRDGLVFAADRCSGCGACATRCPSGALSAAHPTDEALHALIARHAQHSGTVVFACEAHLKRHPEDRPCVVAVPCIARVDESILVGAALAGASSVTLIDAACAACPQGCLSRHAATMVATANGLLQRWGYPAAAAVGGRPAGARPLPPADDEPKGLSRRAFFTAFRKTPADPAAASQAGSVAPGQRSENPGARLGFDGQPRVVPQRLRRLVDDLRRLGREPRAEPFESELWGAVSVSAGCSGCGICAEVCPTGALTVREPGQGGDWALLLDGAHCSQCGLCADVCFPQALRVDTTVSLAAMLEPAPRLLTSKSKEAVDELTAPLEERFSRMFNCQVTS